MRKRGIALMIAGLVLLSLACGGQAVVTPQQLLAEASPAIAPITVVKEQILAENAVGPSWIEWETPGLPQANLVYVDTEEWEIYVMDEHGESKRSLTRKNNNALDVNFPLDEDHREPEVHWKGDPEAVPTAPIVFFKAENEHSEHVPRRNVPSVGWNNDIWALNVETREYTRLTNLEPGHGVQHSAMANDGSWYVYPHRYDFGQLPQNFGYARMVFNRIEIDQDGRAQLVREFAVEPNGPMYYEPIDIRLNEDGSYTLLYVAGSGTRLDPYRFDWTPGADVSEATNTRLQRTPQLHEEFAMFSPTGTKIVWMRGPQAGLKYQADLYLSNPDFSEIQRLTQYNVTEDGRPVSRSRGAQLSRLDWKPDGSAIFFGVWHHDGFLRAFAKTEIRRIDLNPSIL